MLLAASLTGALFVAAPANAFDVNVGAAIEIGVGAGAGGASEAEARGGVQLGLAGQAGGQGNLTTTVGGEADAYVAMVITLILNSQWQGNEFNAAVSGDGAQAHSMATWLTAETRAPFNAAVEQAQQQIHNLQVAIAANSAMSAWLQAENIDLSSVVAVGVDTEGQLVAFTH
jgi:hypothetical protein